MFDYRGIISPPRDLDRWAALVEALVAAPRRAVRARRGRAAGRSRSGTRPNLRVFWAATQSRLLRPVRRHGAGREGGRPAVPRRRPVDRGRRLGRRPARARRARPASRSTSSPPTPTACRRSTCGRSSRGTAAPTCRSGGPSGASARPTARRSTTASGARRSSRAGCARRRAGSTRLAYWVASDHFVELGEPRAAVPRRVRAADRSATCASRASGRSRCSSGSATTELAGELDGRRRRAGSSRRGPSRDDDGRDRDRASGTARSTRRRPDGDAALDRDGHADDRRAAAAASYGLRHHRVDATTRTSRGPGRRWAAATGPTRRGWAALREADRLEALDPRARSGPAGRRPRDARVRPADAGDLAGGGSCREISPAGVRQPGSTAGALPNPGYWRRDVRPHRVARRPPALDRGGICRGRAVRRAPVVPRRARQAPGPVHRRDRGALPGDPPRAGRRPVRVRRHARPHLPRHLVEPGRGGRPGRVRGGLADRRRGLRPAARGGRPAGAVRERTDDLVGRRAPRRDGRARLRRDRARRRDGARRR